MRCQRSSPPKVALWLLRRAYPRNLQESLAGDLVERFCEGQTRSWLWKQVLIALAQSLLGSTRRRWPLFCYASAGTIAMGFSPRLHVLPASLHWDDLAWPWSLLVFELTSPVIAALASLSVLAIGLIITRSFRWASLVRTWVINVSLIGITHFLPDIFPALLRSIPGDPYHKILIVPRAVWILTVALTFFVAGWTGSPIETRAGTADPAGAETP
jgi:hypothetical protein